MKDVDPIRNSDGAVTLSSSRTNLKVDKLTTYVLAKDGLLPAK
jgi:predicted proteasome-type protease